MMEESEMYMEEFKQYADNDNSIYKHLSLSMYYSLKNNKQKAIEHLRLFSKERNIHYWIILFLDKDPLVEDIKEMPEFKSVFKEIKTQLWETHQQIKRLLLKKELI